MSSRVGSRALYELADQLSGRDLAIAQIVSDLRLMSGRQLEGMFFRTNGHESAAAASRAARRTLERLASLRVLDRLDRRIGGVRAGSSGFVYSLGPVGHRLIRHSKRPSSRQPGPWFVAHTLAISDLVVGLSAASTQGRCELLQWQSEPKCWRVFDSFAGRVTVRPDLFVAIGLGEFERQFFIEVDRATQHVPTILGKAKVYEQYYRSGREQAESGLFPKVLFVAPDLPRSKTIRSALQAASTLTNELFASTTDADAIEEMIGGEE